MRAIITLTILLFVAGIFGGYGQNIPTYPIPSYGIAVNGFTNFANTTQQADTNDFNLGKRVVIFIRKSFTIQELGYNRFV